MALGEKSGKRRDGGSLSRPKVLKHEGSNITPGHARASEQGNGHKKAEAIYRSGQFCTSQLPSYTTG